MDQQNVQFYGWWMVITMVTALSIGMRIPASDLAPMQNVIIADEFIESYLFGQHLEVHAFSCRHVDRLIYQAAVPFLVLLPTFAVY